MLQYIALYLRDGSAQPPRCLPPVKAKANGKLPDVPSTEGRPWIDDD